MKKIALIPIAYTILALTSNVLFAQTVKDTMIYSKVEKVIITSNSAQKILLNTPQHEPMSLLPSISKVNREEIEEQGAVTLVDALKYTPGIWIESRGRKVKQMVSVRGQVYPYPSYAINGIWQKEFQELSYFFNSANIESITINRSSSALLNSLSALTGLIDVKTIEPKERKGTIFAKYGSLNSYQTGISFADVKDNFNYTIAVNGNGTDGIKDRNGSENMLNAMASLNWKLSPKLDLGVNIFYIYGNRELIQPIKPADDKFLTRIEEYDPYKAMMVSSKLKYKHNDILTSELTFNYAGREPHYKMLNTVNNKSTEYQETDHEFTTNWINALALSSENTLRFGLLYNYWIAPDGKRFYYGEKAEVHTASVVVTDQHQFGQLLVDGGFRLTRQYYANWGGFSIEGASGPFSKVNPIEDEWQSPEWQATAGLTYSLTQHSSLHFSFAGGVVTPRKGALTDAGNTPKNETRFNFDLGYRQSFSSQSNLYISTFLVKRNDAISYSGATIEEDDGDIMELYKNANMHNFGVEINYHSDKFFNALSFFTNATFMMSQIYENDEWSKDDEIPNFIANLGTNFQRGAFDANAYFNYTSAYKNDRFVSKDYKVKYGKAELGNFATVDLTAGYRLGKKQNVRLFIEAKNIFDNDYQTVAGYPDYGRILSIGCNIQLW